MTHEEVLDEVNVIYERLSHPEDCENGVYSFRDGNYLEALEVLIDYYEVGFIKELENQKTGYWIRLIEDYPECDFEFKGCSVCRTHYPNFAVKQFKYCPNCGVKMKGD